jgi:hypothetical protein
MPYSQQQFAPQLHPQSELVPQPLPMPASHNSARSMFRRLPSIDPHKEVDPRDSRLMPIANQNAVPRNYRH